MNASASSSRRTSRQNPREQTISVDTNTRILDRALMFNNLLDGETPSLKSSVVIEDAGEGANDDA